MCIFVMYRDINKIYNAPMYAGDPPFAKINETELLQHLQRGKHLKRPSGCSNSL